jgi:cytidine deaminase
MRTKELRILVYEYETIQELPGDDRKLVLAAREAAKNAYAPYSKFHVGAAVLLENGKIITGNNQENSAFTNGLCAERVALFYANANFPDVAVKAIAITAENINGLVAEPVKPCGSCRQVMVETESRFKKSIRIILDGKKSIQVFDGIQNLLPFAFKPDSLD